MKTLDLHSAPELSFSDSDGQNIVFENGILSIENGNSIDVGTFFAELLDKDVPQLGPMSLPECSKDKQILRYHDIDPDGNGPLVV